MKAIPTVYRGIVFRSRLEARWAEFFDLIGVRWEYEPEGYQGADLRYLPDFWLPEVCSRGKPGGVFFEVKATSPTERERRKAMMLACGSGRPVIVPAVSPFPPDYESLEEFVGDGEGRPRWEDSGLMFARCARCGCVDVGFYASDLPLCPCGLDHFDFMDQRLTDARAEFQTLSTWSPAA